MKALLVRETWRTLRIARSGKLLPWLGPALRGLTGGRLRARACRFPVAEQLTRWKNCTGCPLMHGCAYGETYEPDPPPGLHLAAGWENGARPILIAPAFPLPEFGHPGVCFDLRITTIGAAARQHLDAVWESLRLGGADVAIGLGDDHVLFDVEAGRRADVEEEVNLPLEGMTAAASAAAVRVEFTAPLFLNETWADQRKHAVLQPSFGQLLRAGLRVLGPLHKLYAESLPETVFAAVKTAAETVPTLRSDFQAFRQAKFSHRTKERFDLHGVVGWAEYGPVPAWLLPWLIWAGRLHVGTHRVAGAGCWRVKAQAIQSASERTAQPQNVGDSLPNY